MRIALPIVIVVGLLSVAVGICQVPPPPSLPMLVYGYVYINVSGELVPAPEGLVVAAKVNNTVVASTLTGADGSYSLLVEAESLNGSEYFDIWVENINITRVLFVSGEDLELNLTVNDSEPPAPPTNVSVVSPVNDTTPVFSWSPAYDNLKVAGYYLKIVNETFSTPTYFTNETLWECPIALSDGVYKLVIWSTDLVGLNSSPAELEFIVDTAAPTLVIEWPQNGTVIRGGDVWINGTVIEVNKGSNTPTVNDTRFELVVWNATTGRFAFRNVQPLPYGTYAISICFTDLANRTTCSVVVFEYQAPYVTMNITLYPGWNLVGISIEPANTSIDVVFGNYTDLIELVVYYYNGTWYVWPPIAGIPNVLKEIHAGMGLWIKVKDDAEPFNLTIVGLPVKINVTLVKGWNLIAVSEKMKVSDFMSATNASLICTYDPVRGWMYYVKGVGGALTVLEPGRGYWVFVESS